MDRHPSATTQGQSDRLTTPGPPATNASRLHGRTPLLAGSIDIVRLDPTLQPPAVRRLADQIAANVQRGQAKVLKAAARGGVLRVRLKTSNDAGEASAAGGAGSTRSNETDLVVKWAPAAGVLRRGLERFGVKPTQPARQWRGAELLDHAGFSTAKPLAWWRSRDPQHGLLDVLVLPWVEGESVLRLAASTELAHADRRGLAESVGRTTRAVALAGLTNRDHKPSNLLARSTGPRGSSQDNAGWRITFVDTVGVEPRRGPLNMTPPLFNLLVECEGVGVRISRSERMRVMHAALGWRSGGRAIGDYAEHRSKPGRKRVRDTVWAIVARRLEKHGDAKPTDDPLRA